MTSNKKEAGQHKTRLAVLAAMPYPTPQGSQVFIGSLVYALRQSGYEVTFHTYPLTDERMVPAAVEQNNFSSPLGQLAAFGDQLAGELGLNDLTKQIGLQLGSLNLGAIGNNIRDSITEFGKLAGLSSPQLLRSGPSLSKIEQDLILLKKTIDQLRDRPPDLLYVHNYEALAMGLPISLVLGIPLIYHAHNVMVEELPTYFKSLTNRFIAMAGGKALDFLPSLADQLIFFSQNQADLLQDHGITEERINIIPPGLLSKEPKDLFWKETDFTAAEPDQAIPEEPFFLYTGNCDNYQNLDLLFEAFGQICDRTAHKLVLCTSSPRPEQVLNNPNIICLNMSSPTQMEILLKKATALVIPRKVSFGFPIKAIQALRAGLPIIGLKSSLSQLILPHEALLVENDASSLASAMLKIAHHPLLKERLSRQSREIFKQRFSLEKQIKEYDYVFQKTIRNNNHNRSKQ